MIALCTQWTLLIWRFFWFCNLFLYYLFNNLSNCFLYYLSLVLSKFFYLQIFYFYFFVLVMVLGRFFSTLLTNSSANFVYFCYHIFNVQTFFDFFNVSFCDIPLFLTKVHHLFFLSQQRYSLRFLKKVSSCFLHCLCLFWVSYLVFMFGHQ